MSTPISDYEDVLCEKNYLFSISPKISYEDQVFLIDYVKKNGALLPAEIGIPSFWIGKGLTSVPKDIIDQVDPKNRGLWYYYARLNKDIIWSWNKNQAAEKVQELLAPIKYLFESFTRVSLIVQIPGMSIPAHRDLVVGDTYFNMESEQLTFKGKKKLQFKGPDWFKDFNNCVDIHKKHLYLNLKIPISENPNSCGNPFIIHDGQKKYYSSDSSYFFLNEAEIEHGADSCQFYRGVIFVDGFINVDQLHSLKKENIKILSKAI